jgi:hypothetical protein
MVNALESLAAPTKKAASRAPWEAAFGRPTIVRPSWLPYAGMTRIRFEGFSRLRVLSA